MVVTSHFDGRIRIRDEGLKLESMAGEVKEAVLASEGVNSVEANPRVGSLLVLYDAAVTAVEKILKVISDLLGSGDQQTEETEPSTTGWRARSVAGVAAVKRLSRSIPAIPPRLKRNLVNGGMLLSLFVSVLLGFIGLKKLHILTGIIFIALFGDHFYLHKERVFG